MGSGFVSICRKIGNARGALTGKYLTLFRWNIGLSLGIENGGNDMTAKSFVFKKRGFKHISISSEIFV